MLAAAGALAMALPFAPSVALGDRAEAVAASFPETVIRQSDTALDWPFSVPEGTLTCVAYQGERVVIFAEPWREDVPQEFGNMTLPRSVVVSANPFAILASLEDRALYRPFDTLEVLIRRLGPFEAMGKRLCEDAGKMP